MATWDWKSGNVTFGGIDFSKSPEQLAEELMLDPEWSKKLVLAATSATDVATREAVIRKVVAVAVAVGVKAGSKALGFII
jgi:hypothetical protein